MIVYRCQDSLENIFTAIYRAYEENREPEDTVLMLSEEPVLFAEDIIVETIPQKSDKVIRTLKGRFGEQDYQSLCLALTAENEEKAQAVYRTVALGLRENCAKGHLFDRLSESWVQKSFALARRAGREVNHMMGFTRFEELEQGALYSRIGPENNILAFLMEHFSDRLPGENFVIYDDKRGLFGLHPAGKPWYLAQGEPDSIFSPALSEKEKEYQELFRLFCRTITIKSRENKELQQNMLPLRFQEYMVEFR